MDIGRLNDGSWGRFLAALKSAMGRAGIGGGGGGGGAADPGDLRVWTSGGRLPYFSRQL